MLFNPHQFDPARLSHLGHECPTFLDAFGEAFLELGTEFTKEARRNAHLHGIERLATHFARRCLDGRDRRLSYHCIWWCLSFFLALSRPWAARA